MRSPPGNAGRGPTGLTDGRRCAAFAEDDAQPREPLTPLGAVVSAGVDMRGNGLRAGPRDRGCFVYALGKGARRPDVLVLCQHAVAEAGAAAWAAAVLDAFPCGRLVVLDALLAADVGAPRPGGPGREGAEPGQAFQWAAGAPFGELQTEASFETGPRGWGLTRVLAGEGAEAVVCPALPDAAALQRLSPAAQALMEGAAARGTPAQLLASVQGLPAPGVADVAAAGAHFQRHLAPPLGLALDVERAVERCGFVQEAYDSDVAVSTFV